jgi:hypothetical protein
MRCLTVSLFIALSAGEAFPQAGHWEAKFPNLDRAFAMSLDLDKNAKGDWIASFGVPVRKIGGMAVSELKVDGPSVKFKVAEFFNSPSFDLKLSGETKLAGKMLSPSAELPVEFVRTGDAKVELLAPSPAVSKQLEGDWTGSVDIPQGRFHLIVHFKNQPDKTVLATMDSPDQGRKDQVLSGVIQLERAVEFKSKMTGASYKGTLNKDSTEMTGEWSQGGSTLPLILKKR